MHARTPSNTCLKSTLLSDFSPFFGPTLHGTSSKVNSKNRKIHQNLGEDAARVQFATKTPMAAKASRTRGSGKPKFRSSSALGTSISSPPAGLGPPFVR